MRLTDYGRGAQVIADESFQSWLENNKAALVRQEAGKQIVWPTSDDLPAWDSMNHITVVVEAECRFDIQFQPAEIEQLTTVRDLVRMIQAKRAQAKRALIHA